MASETKIDTPAPSGQGGGVANLRPPSSSAEARELGRRGGIASGEARRRRASLRDELVALLTADGGVVAKGIAVAICSEAKRGNVGAFKAIAQVLGELKEVIGIEADALPPPITIAVHDPAFVEAERERQRREFAQVVDTAVVEMSPDTSPALAELPGMSGPTAQPSDGGSGNGATVAPSDGKAGAESPGTGTGAAGNAPHGEEGTGIPTDAPRAPRGEFAPLPQPTPLPQPSRIPRTPSEAARMMREREAGTRTAQRDGDGRRSGRFVALPATFPKR